MAAESPSLKLLVVLLAAAVVVTGSLVVRRLWINAGQAQSATNPLPKPAVPAATASDANLDVIIKAAADYAQQEQWGKSEAILKEAVAKYPTEQRVNLAYAECLLKLNKLKDSYAAYERAAALGEVDVRTQITMGTLANMNGRLDRAEEHYSMAMVRDKSNPDAPLFLGQILLKQNKLIEAKANLLIAGRLTPNRSVVWGTLAEIALRENKLDIATQHIKKARDLEPQIVEWRVIAARILNRQSKPEEALDQFVGLDDAARTQPATAQLLAETYGLLRKFPEAAACLARASDANRSRGDLALEASLAAERAGDLPAAKALAQRAIDAGNESAKETLQRLGK